jgi:hypothetical protein
LLRQEEEERNGQYGELPIAKDFEDENVKSLSNAVDEVFARDEDGYAYMNTNYKNKSLRVLIYIII